MTVYAQPGVEPELDTVLRDPIVLLMMKSDGVKREDVIELMERAAKTTHNAPSRTRH
jgi:hypothetical protein